MMTVWDATSTPQYQEGKNYFKLYYGKTVQETDWDMLWVRTYIWLTKHQVNTVARLEARSSQRRRRSSNHWMATLNAVIPICRILRVNSEIMHARGARVLAEVTIARLEARSSQRRRRSSNHWMAMLSVVIQICKVLRVNSEIMHARGARVLAEELKPRILMQVEYITQWETL